MAHKNEVSRTTVIGRLVHFATEEGYCCPAKIIGTRNSLKESEVETPKEGTVHLMVFDPDPEMDGSYRAWNVPHNTAGEPETYHWQDACSGA